MRPRPSASLLVLLALSFSPLSAQSTDDAAEREEAARLARADSARAALEQPKGTKDFTPASVVRAPFQMVGAGLVLLASPVYGVYQLFDETGTIHFAQRANRDLRANGIRVRPKAIGSRSGPALVARWEGARPLFVEGGLSWRLYRLGRAGLFVGDTLYGAEAAVGYQRMTQLHFWGVGPASTPDDRSDYQHTRREVAGRAHARLLPHVRAVIGGGWEEDRVERGRDAGAPDLQDVFEGDLPFGATGTQRYWRADAALDLDFTWIAGPYQLHGARLITEWSGFRGIEAGDPDFQVASTDLRVHLPLNSRHAFALRGIAADAFGEGDAGVPIYALATLGGSEGLRGQKGWRLRDRAMLAGMAEWRYQVWWHPGDPIYRVDAFAFVDRGAVGPSLGSIRWDDFDTTPGIGARFVSHGRSTVETFLAFGGDKPRLGFKLGTSF